MKLKNLYLKQIKNNKFQTFRNSLHWNPKKKFLITLFLVMLLNFFSTYNHPSICSAAVLTADFTTDSSGLWNIASTIYFTDNSTKAKSRIPSSIRLSGGWLFSVARPWRRRKTYLRRRCWRLCRCGKGAEGGGG